MEVVDVAVATDAGVRRQHNEDAVLCLDAVPAFAIADGMGGGGIGSVAAGIAMEVLAENAPHLADRATRVSRDRSSSARLELGQMLESTFNQAHLRIVREAERMEVRGMASTLVSAVIAGGHAYVAHVGDSRAYLLRDGRIRVLTEDHSLAMLRYRQGRMTLVERRTSPLRHRLYQVLGAGSEIDTDTSEVPLAHDDVLILCSDGVTGTLSDEQLGKLADVPSLQDAADRIISAANAAGGPDNASVCLVRIGGATRREHADYVASLLSDMFLFRDLGAVERSVVAPYLEEVVLRPNQTLFREGDPGDAFFMVIKGKVRVTRGRTRLTDIGPGGNFGEISLARSVARSATVTAVERTELFALERERFHEIMLRRPSLGARLSLALLDTVGNRIRDLSDRVVAVRSVVSGELRVDGQSTLELVDRAARGELKPKP